MEKNDAEKLIGALAIALSSSMPKELAVRIADRLDLLAQQMLAAEGGTRVHTLCTDLAQTMREVHPTRH